jgi:hypothetical protein
MAKALPAGRPVRRRALFGLLDSEGWAWATAKAFFWLLVLIITLGYIPDRAYYFVVSRTIELGILGWSPVNLCPPENGPDLPCPAPAGATLPWQASPSEAELPGARAQAAAAQLGTNLLVIGGLDGTEPTSTTYRATIGNGNFGAWSEGPELPEARANASLAILSGTAYLIGGVGPDGEATDTAWSIGLDPDTGELGDWQELTLPPAEEGADPEPLRLPEARAGAAIAAVSDGVIVAGGVGPDGAPTSTVWKSTLDNQGALGEFKEQPALLQPVTDASMALEGTFLWVYGGSDANGPTATVQRADYGTASTATGSAAPEQPTAAATAGQAEPTPAASGAAVQGVVRWATPDASGNLPAPRTGAAGFAANGALYLVGGSDGTAEQPQLYWAIPDASGNLPGGWLHLDASDLPEGRADAAAVVSGSTAFVLGGTVSGTATSNTVRASLAPQEPFFQLGIAGVTVPALQIGGEIGQQLGYLAAAGVGTGNFVLLVAIGWAFNNRPKIAGWWERRKLAREAKAPEPSS